MPEDQLLEFERHLLHSGVRPCHARRSSLEIREHLLDLHAGAVADGMSEHAASDFACQQIGDLQLIAADIISRTELKTWTYRYPKAASLVLPLAYVALLPTTPLFAGVARAQAIARWGVCLMLSAAITGAMFLAMQISILLP